MQPIIPVYKSTNNVLSHPEDICKYVLDAYVRTPKGINDTFHEREISLTNDIAKHIEKESLINVVRENLRSVLENYFINKQMTIDVDIVKTDKDLISNVSINITVQDSNNTYSVGNDITIDRLGNIQVGT